MPKTCQSFSRTYKKATMNNVNGLRVKQARELRKLTQTELARKVGVAQSTIAKMEMTVKEWPDEVIEAIAFQTGFHVSFFQQGLGPEFPLGSLLFRCRASLAGNEKASLRQLAMLVFEIAERLSTKVKPIPLHLPSFNGEDPIVAARITRTTLGLSPDAPIPNLINKLERNGVFVLALPGAHEKFDAFSLWSDTDPRRPIMAVSSEKPGDRLRLNCAHELAHLVLHKSPRGNLADIETEASTFGAEFLLPADAIKREMGRSPSLTDLAKLKPRWGVSIQALVYRARELNVINERQYRYMFEQISRLGWRKCEPANLGIRPEKPRLFRKLAELNYGAPPDAEKIALPMGVPAPMVESMLEAHAAKADLSKGERGVPVKVVEAENTTGGTLIQFKRKTGSGQ
jgi:Zn-dependent peptidase ImmA (M78 family)/DNA-binding XRE family transcriptional regulator